MPSVPLADARAPFVLVLDMGTSSLRAMIYDAQGREVSEVQARALYQARAAEDGEATLDPRAMFDALCRVLDEIVTHVRERFGIAGVAASSLAYNVLGLDENGDPLTPAFLYSDTRNARAVEQLRGIHDWAPIYARTGCPLHTSYLPARFAWLRETQPAIFGRAACWVSLHEYFLLRLFGRAALAHSFAAWSGMLNHETLDWDDGVLNIADVTRAQLSPIRSVNECFSGLRAEFASRWKLLANVPWFPALGDGAAANIGSGCTDDTRVAVTVGTSGAMRVVLPAREGLQKLPRGLWLYRVDESDGLVGGSLNNGGNVFAYFSQLLQLPARDALERALENMPPDSHGLTMLPFFAGERSPGYRGDARAAVTGWSLGTTSTELWRAAVEAISYRFAAIYDLLRAANAPREIIASGAALQQSRAWVQILADVLGMPVTASGEDEASARGAALVALRALGVIRALSDLPAALGESYLPHREHYDIYQRARTRQKTLYDMLLER